MSYGCRLKRRRFLFFHVYFHAVAEQARALGYDDVALFQVVGHYVALAVAERLDSDFCRFCLAVYHAVDELLVLYLVCGFLRNDNPVCIFIKV